MKTINFEEACRLHEETLVKLERVRRLSVAVSWLALRCCAYEGAMSSLHESEELRNSDHSTDDKLVLFEAWHAELWALALRFNHLGSYDKLVSEAAEKGILGPP